MSRQQNRFPFEPLAGICLLRWREPNEPNAHNRVGKISSVLGISRDVVRRWDREGLTPHAADRAATALGLHPLEIWPDFHEVERYVA